MTFDFKQVWKTIYHKINVTFIEIKCTSIYMKNEKNVTQKSTRNIVYI